MEYLLYEEADGIGLLTINRPKALNALNTALLKELSGLLDEIAAGNARCVLVAGAGEKAFVAGADIAEMADFDAAAADEFSRQGNAVFEKLSALPMPTIALVNGYALGGGCELALCCDIRVAAQNAVFSLPEVSLGILPGYGGIQRLTRLVGPGVAAEMVYTTNRYKADAALAIGLVNSVVEPDALLEAGKALAAKIAANAPVGVRAAKAVLNQSIGMGVQEAVNLEAAVFGECFSTADQKEAMRAFVEKRKPEPFQGK